MENKKSLTKTFLAVVLAFAMFFSGMVLLMSQAKAEVYAEGATPTAMQLSFENNILNFYPIFADNNAPAGITFYTESGKTYTQIDKPTMSVIASGGTCYFSGGSVKGFAVVQKSWIDVFDSNSISPKSNEVQSLNENFSTKLNTDGIITPYFYDDDWNNANWNCSTDDEPTINDISIKDIYSTYSSVFNNSTFWSTKVDGSDAYAYDCEEEKWVEDSNSEVYNIVLLCDFTAASTYSVTYDLNEGSGIAPITNTKYAVGDKITLPDGTGLNKTDELFLGWSTDYCATTGNIGSYTIESIDVVCDAITFYAIWGQNQADVDDPIREDFYELKDSLILPTADITGLSFTCGKMENNAFVVYTTISASDGKLIYSNDKTSLEVYDNNAQDKWSYGIRQIIFRSRVTKNSPLNIWLSENAVKHYTYITDEGYETLCQTYELITSSSTSLGATGETKWYVVDSDVIISSRITCTGTVNLILIDGKGLIASEGITVTGNGNSLTIYGQNDGKGVLDAKAEDIDYYSGIGGGDGQYGSNITINGGTIFATGGKGSAGIGGGNGQYGSNITINGGSVYVSGGSGGAGIGGGDGQYGSNITINGGSIVVTGGDDGAAIGGGAAGNGSYITINGGSIYADGGSNAAGIGNGYDCSTDESNIFLGDAVIAKASTSDMFTDSDIVAHPRTNDQLTDVASSFSGKQYAEIRQKYQIAYYDNCTDTVSNMPSDDNYYEAWEEVTISKTTPTRTGYIFLGWATSSDGEVISDETLEMEEGGISLFAKWQQDSSGGSPNTGIYFGGSEALIFSCLALIALGVFVVLAVSKKKEN